MIYDNEMDHLDVKEDKLNELRYEFIKSKRYELENLVKKSDYGFTQWDLHLLMIGCVCSVFLVNIITKNALFSLLNLFLFFVLLNLRVSKDSFTQISSTVLTLFSTLMVVIYTGTHQVTTKHDKISRVLVLLLLVVLNVHLVSWLVLDLKLIGKYSCVSNFTFEVNLFKCTELFAFLGGSLLFACVIFFIVQLYSVSYILFIIVIFSYASRWRFSLVIDSDYLTILDRIKSPKRFRSSRYSGKYVKRNTGRQTKSLGTGRRGTRNFAKSMEIYFFPNVQSLITFFIILITLFILIFTLLNNGMLSLRHQPQFNSYLDKFEIVNIKRFIIKMKLLCIYVFVMLFVMAVQFGLYIFFFFKKTSLLSQLLYNKVVFLFSIYGTSSNSYYNFVSNLNDNKGLNNVGMSMKDTHSLTGGDPMKSIFNGSEFSNTVTNKSTIVSNGAGNSDDYNSSSNENFCKHACNCKNEVDNYSNVKEMRVEAYHLDPWDRVLKVELICKKQLNSYSYFNNYLDNDNFSCMVKKLTSSKLVKSLSHKSKSLIERLNSKNNKLRRGLKGGKKSKDPFGYVKEDTIDEFNHCALFSCCFQNCGHTSCGHCCNCSNDCDNANGKCSHQMSLNLCNGRNGLKVVGRGIGAGCGLFGGSRLNCSELYLFLQNYVLVNHGERSLYCFLRQNNGLNLLVYQDVYILIKNKLIQYNYEFVNLLEFFLNNKLFDNHCLFANRSNLAGHSHLDTHDEYEGNKLCYAHKLSDCDLCYPNNQLDDRNKSDSSLVRGMVDTPVEHINLSGVLGSKLHTVDEIELVNRLSIPTEYLSSNREEPNDSGVRLLVEEEDIISSFSRVSGTPRTSYCSGLGGVGRFGHLSPTSDVDHGSWFQQSPLRNVDSPSLSPLSGVNNSYGPYKSVLREDITPKTPGSTPYLDGVNSIEVDANTTSVTQNRCDNEVVPLLVGSSSPLWTIGSNNLEGVDANKTGEEADVENVVNNTVDHSDTKLAVNKADSPNSNPVSDKIVVHEETKKKKKVKYLTRFFNRKFSSKLSQDDGKNLIENFENYRLINVTHSGNTDVNSPVKLSGTVNDASDDNMQLDASDVTVNAIDDSMSAKPALAVGESLMSSNHSVGTGNRDAVNSNEVGIGSEVRTGNPLGDMDGVSSGLGGVSENGSLEKEDIANDAVTEATNHNESTNFSNSKFEVEYVVTSTSNYKKMFSTVNSKKNTSLRIKKLQLDNNFNNNYIYTRTIKFNTANKYLFKNDSTGTNPIKNSGSNLGSTNRGASLVRAQGATGPRSPNGLPVDLRRDYLVDFNSNLHSPNIASVSDSRMVGMVGSNRGDPLSPGKLSDAQYSANTTPRRLNNNDDLMDDLNDDFGGTSRMNLVGVDDESVEVKVNSIMDELMKDLNLDTF